MLRRYVRLWTTVTTTMTLGVVVELMMEILDVVEVAARVLVAIAVATMVTVTLDVAEERKKRGTTIPRPECHKSNASYIRIHRTSLFPSQCRQNNAAQYLNHAVRKQSCKHHSPLTSHLPPAFFPFSFSSSNACIFALWLRLPPSLGPPAMSPTAAIFCFA